jgi:hypothetical protein
MSIMKLAAIPHEAAAAEELESSVRAFLDHIAVELAEEHIRLMKAAANAKTADGYSATVA